MDQLSASLWDRPPLPPDQLRERSARELCGVEANDRSARSLRVTCSAPGFWPTNEAELARLGDALGRNTHVTSLSLVNDNAGSLARLLAGNQGFFDGLARNSSFSTLVLWEFDFSADPATLGQLVTSSGNNAHVVHIHLLGCNLGNGAAGTLASAVASSLNYYELHLGGNGIADDTVEALVSGIKGCRKPLRLNLLGRGSGFTSAGFNSLATLLVQDPACNLMSIQIAEISLDDERAEILATALKGSTTLQFLTLDGSITAQGWQSLARALCDDACPNETYHSNHTLHTIKQRIPPQGVHDHDVPANIKSLLRYNRPASDKKVIAIEKLFRCPVLDMTPFIQEWDLRMLPFVVDWFAMVERQTRMCVGERKLLSIYQFVRALPLMVVSCPKMAGDKRKANDIVW